MPDSTPILNRRALLRTIAAGGVLAAAGAMLGCGARPHPQGGGSSGAPPVPSTTAVPGSLVMIIRHGEKPDSSSPLPGVDINGNPAGSSSLTEVGWNRARHLVDVFDPPGGSVRPGLARPKVIYAAGANEGGSGERARETVTPLAQRLGISVNAAFGKGDEDALATEITAQPGPTLICWQHGEIPAIAQAFGSVSPNPPDTWPDDRFDVIWTLTATVDGWTFGQLPEMVLPGDQTQTIAD
jgi:hypothetical protein